MQGLGTHWEKCKSTVLGEIKVKGLGTGRTPGCKSHWGCMCLDVVVVLSLSKTVFQRQQTLNIPINPGFSPVCLATIQKQNFLSSCTVGHMGLVG